MKINRQQFLQELKLREQIRKVIGIIRERKQAEQAAALIEETRLRNVIRQLIKEEEGQGDESTGISYLRRDLKKIVPELEEGYKALKSKEEQRKSYRTHILSAVQDIIVRSNTNFNARSDDDSPELEEPLSMNEEIDVKFGDELPDPAKKLDIGREVPENAEEEQVSAEEEELEAFAISGEDKTGAAAAMVSMNQIENVIKKTYNNLYDPNDRELYADYLITNLQLYFDEFEKELSALLPEPVNPDYEQRKVPSEPDSGLMDEESDPL